MKKQSLALLLTALISVNCNDNREYKVINALNRCDAQEFIQLTSENFKYNGKLFSKSDAIKMCEVNHIAEMEFILDSTKVEGDSSILFVHWTSAINKQLNIPPYPSQIHLLFNKNKIKTFYFLDYSAVLQAEQYKHIFQKYLIWLENNHPSIYNQMDKISSKSLDNYSLYVEYNRLLHLKLNEYQPN